MEVSPIGRGFDEFYGKYEGGGDHWTHTFGRHAMQADSRDGGVWPGHPDYVAGRGALDLHHDVWVDPIARTNYQHEHLHGFNGTHSSDVIGMAAAKMISEHDASGDAPLFLYVAFQAPHWPVQNPMGTEEKHLHIPGKQRRKWCGLVSHIDDNMGRIVAALAANGNMWANTWLFAFSDNGGDVRTGASNFPFRGDKMTPWEGGTKVPAFFHTPNERLLDKARRGTTHPGIAHVTDLFPTILHLAGGNAHPTATGPLDGIDLWPSWQRGGDTSDPLGSGGGGGGGGGGGDTSRKRLSSHPRTEMLYNVDDEGLAVIGAAFFAGGKQGAGGMSAADALRMTRRVTNGNVPEKYEAIRIGRWKLIRGFPGRGDWYGTDPSAAWGAPYIMGPDATNYELLRSGGPFGDMKLGDGGQAAMALGDDDDDDDGGGGGDEGKDDGDRYEAKMKRLWLFDLDADPAEHHDRSAELPDVVAELGAKLDKYASAAAPAIITEPNRWSESERQRVQQLSLTSFRSVPGKPYKVLDFWQRRPAEEGGRPRSKL